MDCYKFTLWPWRRHLQPSCVCSFINEIEHKDTLPSGPSSEYINIWNVLLDLPFKMFSVCKNVIIMVTCRIQSYKHCILILCYTFPWSPDRWLFNNFLVQSFICLFFSPLDVSSYLSDNAHFCLVQGSSQPRHWGQLGLGNSLLWGQYSALWCLMPFQSSPPDASRTPPPIMTMKMSPGISVCHLGHLRTPSSVVFT